jgi:hypothetical protein
MIDINTKWDLGAKKSTAASARDLVLFDGATVGASATSPLAAWTL